MFVNKEKKSYEKSYIIESIKSDIDYKVGYQNCIKQYNDDEWCTQFLSQLYKEFEVVVVKNVRGMKDGFYILDRNYTKFTSSSFIKKKLSKIVMKEMGKKPMVSMLEGLIQYNKTYSNKIDKYFIQYIKGNTLIDYTFDEFVKEFEPHKVTNNQSYQPNHKSPHRVNGFWRNQPYASRSNPQYKRIWINSFEKGVS